MGHLLHSQRSYKPYSGYALTRCCMCLELLLLLITCRMNRPAASLYMDAMQHVTHLRFVKHEQVMMQGTAMTLPRDP